jgi:hypothetical protein
MAHHACWCRPGIGVLCLLLLSVGQLPSRLADPDACAVDVGARSDCGKSHGIHMWCPIIDMACCNDVSIHACSVLYNSGG